jgi:Pvc16 N-terminal domain/Carboxypeptidase regulatory-like domain
MLDDLDASLRRLLDDADAPAELQAADVSFVTPGRDYAPSQPTVNLFLHQVHEHAELRDPGVVVERSGNGFVRRRPPLRVECVYLVTAWADASAEPAVKVDDEHRLLGQALGWLRRFPTIPADRLQGSLASQPVPPPAMVARPDRSRNPGEFWTALGIAPRPCLDLSVTIGIDLEPAVAEGPTVTTAELRLPPADPAYQIAGTVRRGTASVPAATVSLSPGGRATVADADGRFSFPGLAAGDYTLHASAEGQGEAEQPIRVPDDVATPYDLTLPP